MSSTASDHLKHPHLDHVFKIGVLMKRVGDKTLPLATRHEAAAELRRYSDEGRIINQYGREVAPVATKKNRARAPRKYSGQGILFAVIDDREAMREGKVTTIDVITEAIEEALDSGKETSEEIARYLTTSAFQHEKDRRVRFNSVLKAGDAVGAQITRKLYNSYNELAKMAEEEDDPIKKKVILAEATGFAEALNVVISPFSCEDPEDPRLVNWEEVDRITAAFEKEQRYVRKERKDTPQ